MTSTLAQMTAAYAPVIEEMRQIGVRGYVHVADGGGFQLAVDMPGNSVILIGNNVYGEHLTTTPDQTHRWHAQHEGETDHIAIVFHDDGPTPAPLSVFLAALDAYAVDVF